jgi:hypothetical protein
MNEQKAHKGILNTNSKQGGSKSRRISWGEIKIKEYESDGEVHEKKEVELVQNSYPGTNPNNITIGGNMIGLQNDTIMEEPSSYEASRTPSIRGKLFN